MSAIVKSICIYWVIGCFLGGMGVVEHFNQCPNDPRTSSVDIVAFAATWPLVFGGMAVGIKQPLRCAVQP